MNENPLVSVVICVYNAEQYLRGAVQSILSQTYENLDILVIDDGSTDRSMDTIADIRDTRLRCFQQENQGKSVALNWALDELRGAFYAIQDADDLSYPTRVERLVHCLRENPEVAAVFSGHDLILGNRRLAPRFRDKTTSQCLREIARMRMPAHDPTAMYRVELVRGVRYATELRIGQGYDYILRIGERLPMLVVGECLYSYRVHQDSATRVDSARRRDFVRKVIFRACERRGRDFSQVWLERDHYGAAARSDNNLAAHFIESALDLRRVGRRADAIRVALSCSAMHPVQPHYHKALVYALSPWWLIRRIRGSEFE